MENLKFVKIVENIVKKTMNFIEKYKNKNRIKKFQETKAKVAQFEVKQMLSKIEELQDKLDSHDHKESCECYKIHQEIKDLKERLHDEVISNDTDLILNTRC